MLVASGLGAPNPLSFGARAASFDPERPGIAGVARHPLPLALAFWAAAHAVANGDLAHVSLFGAFAGFALLGVGIIDRRKRRLIGADEWGRLAARTSAWPFAALIEGRWRPSAPPGLGRLGAGLLLWLALLALHAPVVGVSPLPPG